MGEKIVVGPINLGIQTDHKPFVIDNDAFPTLINAYQWRGRIKRKRGTSLLGRLERYFDSTIASYGSTSSIALSSGAANILTGFSLQTNGNIVPGSVTVTNATVAQTYTDPSEDGTLAGSLGGTGTINYATGAVTITGGGGNSINAKFLYYPDLPVMGIEDLVLSANQFPSTLAFDTVYSYMILNTSTYGIYDVSFYKNPPTATYTDYTHKTTVTPTNWSGQDYQQFWTTNYQNALWATNGIEIPFNSSTTKVGMQFKAITTVDNITAGPPGVADLTIASHGLVVGDFIFVNEVATTTGINFQTGYVTVVVSANKVTVKFLNATLATNGAGGIAQYLTRQADTTKDCLRWYDGDPTDGSVTSPALTGNLGWVNFMPPISSSNFLIDDLPPAQYYLVGARIIVPFKDRLLFFGPVVQTSTGTPKYLQDTVVYSQNGTPYYTASFTGSTTSAATVFNPILTPANQGAAPNAFFDDVPGFGGFLAAGVSQPITSVGNNEDVLIVGFTNKQTRFVYSGNDLLPFNFFIVNSEYGTGSTFSGITMDQGVMTIGSRGIVMTAQVDSERKDLQIPDQIFQFNLSNNGTQRITAQRDFINEWIYFTYPDNEVSYKFPNQTLQYNYRDETWAIFNETYTTYGQFNRASGDTWATIGATFPTWAVWNETWSSGSNTLFQPQVIAGNQQGFIVFRDDGTDEANSLYIRSFSGNTVTAPDHCLNDNDYIIINGCIGTIGALVNGRIFQVSGTTTNTFTINSKPPISVTGTYFGGGTIQRMYVPLIQTRQFPIAWNAARKTRIGAQQYLLSTTYTGQIELQIYLSQNAVGTNVAANNRGTIIPDPGHVNNALVYTDILYTCPESTNLGLTPANTNLQMPTAAQQQQIWHRMNTSLIGDTVQLGFTLSDDQMRATLSPSGDPFAITAANKAYPCAITCAGEFSANSLVTIAGVVGMTELNGNTYSVVSSNATTVFLDVDSTSFTTYVSGGTATALYYPNQFAEIELHAFIIDAQPAGLLA